MKKIAALMLFLFALVQVGPVVSSLFKQTNSVLVMDEEKGEDKTEAEKKEKKDYTTFAAISGWFSHAINTAFHVVEKIQAFPWLEKITPPPNFC